jgi:hypothetical protein
MNMAEDRGSGGPSIALIAVIAILAIAGLAIWFTTREKSPEMMPDTSNSTTIENRAGGATTSEPSTVEKDTGVMPDSVTIDTR